LAALFVRHADSEGLVPPVFIGEWFPSHARKCSHFDTDHAKAVLARFGQALGKLPSQLSDLSKDENDFLSSVATGLTQDGRVISVRLSLFADMVKSKPWTPATWREVGGTEGIGVTFLEETFSGPSANPSHRLHQKTARSVLKSLLPEQGTDIKGNMRSRQELLVASGYGDRPKDFDALIRILDNEVRLITPTDPEGVDSDSASTNDDHVNVLIEQVVCRFPRTGCRM
jgi:hypothetical protein